MKGTRGLSPAFMFALQNHVMPGINRFLEAVKRDQTLCLEIRDDFINIYYRGGNLIEIRERNGRFIASFDRKYIICPEHTRVPPFVRKDAALDIVEDVTIWIEAIPFMKQEMDWWFGIHCKEEREAQQLIVRENNICGSAKSTDYFICDIEYANANGRFDLVAVHWPSTGVHRKNNKNVGLALIELKYLDKSMVGASGILAHVQSVANYLRRYGRLEALKEEMCTVFNQKLELGLIDNQKPIICFDDNPPDLILIFANHDPASEILMRELVEVQAIAGGLPFKVKCATSNFMGYGLFEQNVFELEDFVHRYSRHIYDV